MIRLVPLSFVDSRRSLRTFARGATAALAASTALVALAACGDPLVTASYRGDPIYSVQGTVTQGVLEEAPSTSQEVGVLWLNLLDDNSTVLIEATPADVIGNELPAGFDVSVLQPPSDRMLGTALISYNEDGSSAQPVDRNRVAFGVVVVAPEGTFAGLPDATTMSEFIGGSSGVIGPVLSQFTYVSPFTVRYVKGANAEEITIRDINGVPSVLTDFTIFDVGNWARGIDTALCRDRRLGEGWQAPEVQSCIVDARAENDDAIACRSDCGAFTDETPPEEQQAIADCQQACPAERSSQDIENTCLFAYDDARAAETDGVCGVIDYAAQDFRNSRRLEVDEELTLPLGDGDIRGALAAGGFTFLG
jgi:hypothetical protein